MTVTSPTLHENHSLSFLRKQESIFLILDSRFHGNDKKGENYFNGNLIFWSLEFIPEPVRNRFGARGLVIGILYLLPGPLVFNLLGSLWNRPLRDELNIAPDLHYIPDGLFDLFF